MLRARLFGLTLLLFVTATAVAADRPFKSSVTATWDNVFDGLLAPPATFVGGGPTTHMGNTIQTGNLFLVPTLDPGVFLGTGTVTLTASNDDTLTFDYVGTLDAFTGEGIGTFIFTGGTGRFANATGSGTFFALIDTLLPNNQPMTVELDGSIDF